MYNITYTFMYEAIHLDICGSSVIVGVFKDNQRNILAIRYITRLTGRSKADFMSVISLIRDVILTGIFPYQMSI